MKVYFVVSNSRWENIDPAGMFASAKEANDFIEEVYSAQNFVHEDPYAELVPHKVEVQTRAGYCPFTRGERWEGASAAVEAYNPYTEKWEEVFPPTW